jgi:hypothetical protein
MVPAGNGDVRDSGPRGGEIGGEVALEAHPRAGVKVTRFALQRNKPQLVIGTRPVGEV